MRYPTSADIDHVVLDVFALYEKFGDSEYIGEPVSQLEHMSQAAKLAIDEGYSDEVVLAAFFHDIGHICVIQNELNDMDGYGIKSHEKVGADFLREKGFPEKIAQLVENHVQAKRYLTFRDPAYFDSLSDASRKTLEFQGGVMTADEADQFERDALFELSIRMRKWDELAKEIDCALVDLENLKSRARRVLAGADPTL